MFPSFEVLWKFVEVLVLNGIEPVFVNGSACCSVNANPRERGTKGGSHLVSVVGLEGRRAKED